MYTYEVCPVYHYKTQQMLEARRTSSEKVVPPILQIDSIKVVALPPL